MTSDGLEQLLSMSEDETRALLRCVGARLRGDAAGEQVQRERYRAAKRERETITVRGEVRS